VTLDAALCLRNFPSQTVERHNKPEVRRNPRHPKKSDFVSRLLGVGDFWLIVCVC